ncbi:META domain-containing protein [Sphingomonas sp.]
MRAFFPLPLLATAACAMTPPPGDGASEERYRALGTEPFWSITIADGRMRYTTPDGDPIDVAAPAPRQTASGRRYSAPGIVLDIAARPCSDGMSDRTYPDTASVRIGRQTLNGCGGPLDEAAILTGGEWRIVAIDGTPLPERRPGTLSFDGERISGWAGCNRFSGGYAIEGGRLVAGNLASTRMMCGPPLMAQETRVFALLRQPLAIRWGEDDALILTSPDNGTIALRRDES